MLSSGLAYSVSLLPEGKRICLFEYIKVGWQGEFSGFLDHTWGFRSRVFRSRVSTEEFHWAFSRVETIWEGIWVFVRRKYGQVFLSLKAKVMLTHGVQLPPLNNDSEYLQLRWFTDCDLKLNLAKTVHLECSLALTSYQWGKSVPQTVKGSAFSPLYEHEKYLLPHILESGFNLILSYTKKIIPQG